MPFAVTFSARRFLSYRRRFGWLEVHLSSGLKLVGMTKPQATVLGLLFAAGVLTPILVGSGPGPQGGVQSNAGLKEGSPGGLQANPETAAAGASDGAQPQTNTPLARLQAFLSQAEQGHSVWGVRGDEQQTMNFLIWSLPAADYPKAFGFAGELRLRGLRPLFERNLLIYWGEFDPPAALAAAQTVRDVNPLYLIGGDLLWGWVGKDPAAVLSWIRQNATEGLRGFALAQVLPKLARTDPQAALAGLAEMPSRLQQQRTLVEVVQQWAAQDPAAAANWATNFPPSTQRSKLIASVAETWARKDFDAALAWAQTLPEADQASAQDGTLREIGDTIEDWAKTSLDQAIRWVKHLPEGPLRTLAIGGLVEQWKLQDPAGAAEFVTAMPAEKAQQELLSGVLSSWTSKDSKAAIDWVKGLADGPMRDAGLKAVCEALAMSWPAGEAASLIASLAPGEAQSQVAGNVAGAWALCDPMAALQWVAAFPEGQARASAIEHMGADVFRAGAPVYQAGGPPGLDASRKWLNETVLFSAEEKLTLLGK